MTLQKGAVEQKIGSGMMAAAAATAPVRAFARGFFRTSAWRFLRRRGKARNELPQTLRAALRAGGFFGRADENFESFAALLAFVFVNRHKK